MAGHRKWSKVQQINGPLDQKRGQLFSKLAKEITVAARMGGGDPGENPRLCTAILTARVQSMINGDVDRAIKQGTEPGDHAPDTAVSVYEAYVPRKVAPMIEAATNRKSRAAADLRLILSKNHGTLATPGAVGYMFPRKGRITVPAASISEGKLLELVIDAGGEELVSDEETHVITTAPDQLYAVADSLKAMGVAAEPPKLTFIPETQATVTDKTIAAPVVHLIEVLEDSNDVQHVHLNFAPSDEVLASLSA